MLDSQVPLASQVGGLIFFVLRSKTKNNAPFTGGVVIHYYKNKGKIRLDIYIMLYILTVISVLEVLIVTVPVLLTVAFVTIAERKQWQVCKEDLFLLLF